MPAPVLANLPCGTNLQAGYTIPAIDHTVTNRSELDDFITDDGTYPKNQKWDVLLDPGEYGVALDVPASCSGGSVGNEIKFWASQAGAVTFTGVGSATVQSGNYTGIRLHGCDHVWWYGIAISAISDTGFVFGKYWSGDPADAGNINNKLFSSRIHDCGQAGIHGWSDLNDIEVAYCLCHDNGDKAGANGNGEGIYFGQGGEEDDSQDIWVHHNEIHNENLIGGGTGYGEGIDMKVGLIDCIVEYNYIHHLRPYHQAGITLLLNDTADYGSVDPNMVCRYNVIHDIELAPGGDGGRAMGINIGEEFGIQCYGNVIWDIGGDGIRGDLNGGSFLGPSTNVGGARTTVQSNTLWDCNLVAGTTFIDIDWTTTDTANITDDASGQYNAAGADFDGPLTGDADSGPGPGSGFILPDGSAAATGATGVMTTDMCGTTMAAEFGAFAEAGDPPIPGGGGFVIVM